MVHPVKDTFTGTLSVNSCLDKQAEDFLPEDQAPPESSRTLLPERYEDDYGYEDPFPDAVESEASVSPIARPAKRNRDFNSSEEVSADRKP